MYEIFEQLLEEHGITAYRVAKETGVTTATLTSWKQGKYIPKKEKLQKIADYLGVSVDYILGITTYIKCRDCGYEYSTADKSQIKEHENEHKKWEKAVDKFEFCWTKSVLEREKAASRVKLDTQNLTKEEKINENINIFKALFSRSLSADFNLNHPDFNSYAAMLLNQKQFQKKLEPEIYEELVKLFGKQEGINEGETYYNIMRSGKKLTLAAHKETDENWTPEELKKIEDYKRLLLLDREHRS